MSRSVLSIHIKSVHKKDWKLQPTICRNCNYRSNRIKSNSKGKDNKAQNQKPLNLPITVVYPYPLSIWGIIREHWTVSTEETEKNHFPPSLFFAYYALTLLHWIDCVVFFHF